MEHDIEPESIDLIYLDPPFFTGKVQKGFWQPGAMEVSYEDSRKFWASKSQTMRDNAPEWLKHIALQRPDFASYLYYMMERLQLCHKILKQTGSIYLHCDEKASHYLKMIMDEIFDVGCFRRELIWNTASLNVAGYKTKANNWIRAHDIIFYYTKTSNYIFKKEYTPHSVEFNNKNYKYSDDKGLYRITRRGNKVYFNDDKGEPIIDVWNDILSFNYVKAAKESVGYPTQKPLALLKRIINASSNEGDFVLDPFCGCGTCIVAAGELNRQWVGIDISKFAYDVIINRKDVQSSLFGKALCDSKYITRNFDEAKGLNPSDFEAWVNEFYKATKPYPDKGVDGIMQDGTPIQTKTYLVKYPLVSEFLTNIKLHPLVKQPVKNAIMVSQIGFDGSALKRQFEIEKSEGIKIEFKTPEQMLTL
jgi:site-specific DNA-methyltransferase (adenine-specific)